MFHLQSAAKYRCVRPVRFERSHDAFPSSNNGDSDFDDFNDFDSFYVQDENVLPAAPYPEECYFAPTTFLSDKSLTPSKLYNALEPFLQSIPLVTLRVQKKNPWALYYEFFYRGKKNEFKVSFFSTSDAGDTRSCLVEMHLSSGDHAPFQKLAEAVRQKFNLTYAFGSVTSTMSSKSKLFNDFDFGFGDRVTITKNGPSGHCNGFGPALDAILIHLQSPFRDVQVQGWGALSRVTGTKAVAEALLKRKIDDRNALTEIQLHIDESNNEPNLQRLALKTLKDVVNAVEHPKSELAINALILHSEGRVSGVETPIQTPIQV